MILVVLQRANRRAVAGDEIVPRPARAKPRLGKGVVVADEMTVDDLHAARGNLSGPRVERRPPIGMPRIDGGIAAADDDEVAVEGAVGLDRASGKHAGRVAKVPSEPACGRGHRQQLLVRGRDHHAPLVQREQRVADGERGDRDRELCVRDGAAAEDGRQLLIEPRGGLGWIGRCGLPRRSTAARNCRGCARRGRLRRCGRARWCRRGRRRDWWRRLHWRRRGGRRDDRRSRLGARCARACGERRHQRQDDRALASEDSHGLAGGAAGAVGGAGGARAASSAWSTPSTAVLSSSPVACSPSRLP